jgi:hypothetical protein
VKANKTKAGDGPRDRADVERDIRAAAQGRKHQDYLLGQLWIEVIDGQLWRDADCKSPAAYVSKTFVGLDLHANELSHWASVAREVNADDENTFGMDRLIRLQIYGILRHMDVASPVAKLPIEVPDGSGDVTRKAFSDCTEAEMKKAISHLEGKDVVTPMPDSAVKVLTAIKQELLGLTHYAVSVAGRMVDGKLLLGFEGIELSELSVFLNSILGLGPFSISRKARRR